MNGYLQPKGWSPEAAQVPVGSRAKGLAGARGSTSESLSDLHFEIDKQLSHCCKLAAQNRSDILRYDTKQGIKRMYE